MYVQEGDDADICSLSNDNLLLAGTVLKNTKEVNKQTLMHTDNQEEYFQLVLFGFLSGR